jgi:hypothetical protein
MKLKTERGKQGNGGSWGGSGVGSGAGWGNRRYKKRLSYLNGTWDRLGHLIPYEHTTKTVIFYYGVEPAQLLFGALQAFLARDEGGELGPGWGGSGPGGEKRPQKVQNRVHRPTGPWERYGHLVPNVHPTKAVTFY